MKKYILNLVLSLFLVIPAVTFAQAPPPPPNGTGREIDAPLDGGLSLLVGSGVAFLAKKGYDKRRKEKKQANA